jgi:hypothetical protein
VGRRLLSAPLICLFFPGAIPLTTFWPVAARGEKKSFGVFAFPTQLERADFLVPPCLAVSVVDFSFGL